MSEPKGTFSVAIATLRIYNASLTVSDSERKSREAAIRLLEAAGKVDKGALTTFGASSVLDDILVEMTIAFPEDRQRFVARYTRGERDFRALLKALPDKEEK